ncbi:MAG TPA: sigma 54-interacting transcriptional regulator [Desulfomonilaceae bacterium]|nr:sigma 54-interacting transcriptional regulator [Desulfomonilaceae bacterium]
MPAPRILIVEDERLVVNALVRNLEGLGYKVVSSVSTGEDAIARVKETLPDLVLMDIRLEGEMDGIEAAGQISSQFDIPIVFVTAYADQKILAKAKITEPYGYLVKPLSKRELHAAIEIAIYKHEMARRLKVSEEKFRGLAELLPQIIYEIDLNGKFTFANLSGLKSVGYTIQDLNRGVHVTELILPEDRDRMIRDMTTVLKGETIGAEFTVMRKDGTTFPVVTHAAPITRDGKIVGLRGVCVDITELKALQDDLQKAKDQLEIRVAERTAELAVSNEELRTEVAERLRVEEELRRSEELFRTIVETATDCIFIKDHDLRYTFVNPAMTNLMDLRESGVAGLTDTELFGKEEARRLRDVEKRVLEGERIEHEHTRQIKGNSITFLETRVPLRDSAGAVAGLCGIARNITERKRLTSFSRPVHYEFRSRAMRAALDAAHLASQTDSVILLTGESGSGKDHLAKYIHNHSNRAAGPYYAINCAAVPSELADSELFGHEAGAFTGATGRKRGLLELAEGGTLLLNEIGDLPIHLQAKLLTFLDTRSFTRVGGEKTVTVVARLIAATNKDIEKEVKEGRFRADLFYRLNVLSIKVPPLRERVEDLPVLVEQLMHEISAEIQLHSVPEIDPESLRRITRYSWPGNIRELRNVLERALILGGGGPLSLSFLEMDMPGQPERSFGTERPRHASYNDAVADFKRALIEDAIASAGGKRQEAARLLGMTRHSLKRQMKTLGFF